LSSSVRWGSNPDYPKEKHLRIDLYEGYKSCKTPLTQAEILAVRAIGDAHWNDEGASKWQVDPLVRETDRVKRAAALASMGEMSLAEEYKAHRYLTRHFLSRAAP
jgi:hypothetical protein